MTEYDHGSDEINTIGALMYVRDDVRQALELVSRGVVTAGDLVTERPSGRCYETVRS